jgi:hypothetical protein
MLPRLRISLSEEKRWPHQLIQKEWEQTYKKIKKKSREN